MPQPSPSCTSTTGATAPARSQIELQSTVNAVEVREIMFGFDLKVTYDIYGADYQYDHVWRFLEDGQFSSTIIIQGPGEEIDGRHTYHIPFRFDLDVSGAGGDYIPAARAAGWDDVQREGRFAPTAPPVLGLARARPTTVAGSASVARGSATTRSSGRFATAGPKLGVMGRRRPGRPGLAGKRAGDLRRRPERSEHERRALVHRARRLGGDSGGVRPGVPARRLRRTRGEGAADA